MRHQPPGRRFAAFVALVAAALSCFVGVAANPTAASAAVRKPAAAVPVPKTPTDLPTDIESPWTPYVAQDDCDPAFKRGTKMLIALLHTTYPDVYSGGSYACGTDGTVSEHYDGRAIDWMASVRNKRQRAEARALIHWLLATDSQGNHFAMARRLGVMYLIFDNRIWGSWGGGRWEPYNNCDKTPQRSYDNACHRTHVHISLTWNGAMGRTSFWRGKVFGTDYGPCRTAGLTWAPAYHGYNPTPCPRVPAPTVPKRASPTVRALAQYSGLYLRTGSTGPAVSAVQGALGVATSGTFRYHTKAAVRRFQRAHKLHATGAMNRRTWRTLLAIKTA